MLKTSSPETGLAFSASSKHFGRCSGWDAARLPIENGPPSIRAGTLPSHRATDRDRDPPSYAASHLQSSVSRASRVGPRALHCPMPHADPASTYRPKGAIRTDHATRRPGTLEDRSPRRPAGSNSRTGSSASESASRQAAGNAARAAASPVAALPPTPLPIPLGRAFLAAAAGASGHALWDSAADLVGPDRA